MDWQEKQQQLLIIDKVSMLGARIFIRSERTALQTSRGAPRISAAYLLSSFVGDFCQFLPRHRTFRARSTKTPSSVDPSPRTTPSSISRRMLLM
jgi:hypothetical protein